VGWVNAEAEAQPVPIPTQPSWVWSHFPAPA